MQRPPPCNGPPQSNIGSAVATLTRHPKLDISKLAASLLSKWRAMVEEALFKRQPYDVMLAMAAPESLPEDAPPPPPPVAAAAPPDDEAAAQHKLQQERRRRKEARLLGSDDEDAESIDSDSGSDSDSDWRPGMRRIKRLHKKPAP